MSYAEQTQLKNVADTVINPATEDTLNQMLYSLGNTSSGANPNILDRLYDIDIQTLNTVNSLGEVQVTPTQYTIQDRLKTLDASILGLYDLISDVVNLKNVAMVIINPATEEKQDSIISEIQGLAGIDYATETTLQAVNSDTQSIDATLNNVNATLGEAVDSPIQYTIADRLKTLDISLGSILAIDFALESGGNLATIAGKDFATETTLDEINTKIGEVQASPTTYTILDRLNEVGVGTSVTANNTTTANSKLTDIVYNTLITQLGIGEVDASPTANTILDRLKTANTLLGTIDADTGAIKTAVEIIDNAISGSEMQVDVVAALPAGTNLIGKFGIDQTTDGATNKVYVGNTVTVGSHAVTNAGTFVVQNKYVLPLATNVSSTLTLTSASTAYQITEPTSDFMVTYCNMSDTDMYWGLATLTTGGILLPKNGGILTLKCVANNSPFFYCASASKVLNYTTTLI